MCEHTGNCECFQPTSQQFLRSSTERLNAEKERRKKGVRIVGPFHARGFTITQCFQYGVDYGLINGTCTSSTSIARPSRQSS